MKFKKLLNSTLVKKVGISFFLKISQAFLGFSTAVLIARILGPKDYGIYTYALTFVYLFSIPAQGGLSQLVIRETARGIAEEKPEIIKGIWYWAFKIAIFISLILLVVVGSIFFILIFKKSEFALKEKTFFLALLLIPLFLFNNLWGACLRGLHKIITGQLPEFFIRPGLFLIFLCIANFIFHQSLTSAQVMKLYVFATAITFFIGVWFLYRNIPLSLYKVHPVYEEKNWINSLLSLTFEAVMWTVNTYIDVVILGMFKSPTEVGIYKVASQLALLTSFGLQAVNTVLAPYFSMFYVKKEIKKLQYLATRSAQAVFTFNLLVTGFLIVFGKNFLNFLFGKAFLQAYIPLLILLGGQLVNSAAGSVGFLLNMTGHEKDTAKGMALSAVFNIILNFFLIPFLGANGAAIATAVSMIMWNLILWWFVRKRLCINSSAFNFNIKG